MTDLVFAAFRGVPDYTAPAPPLVSLHRTLEGAIKALYPEEKQARFRDMFTQSDANTWYGPDGFGLVRMMEVAE